MAEAGAFERTRNGNECLGELQLPWLEQNYNRHHILRVGDTVELRQNESQPGLEDSAASRDFLRVTSIFQNLENDDMKLRGYRLRQCEVIEKDLLPKRLNDLCILLSYREGDRRDSLDQSLQEIGPQDLVCDKNGRLISRKLVVTNASDPRFSFRDPDMDEWFYHYDEDDPSEVKDRRALRQGSILVCRWILWRNQDRDRNITVERIAQGQADAHYRSLSGEISRDWLGVAPGPAQYYTFGDLFCGAGGFTEGAKAAGARVQWGVDKDEKACSSWWHNNKNAMLYKEPIEEFLRRLRPPRAEGLRSIIVILHISPPCQFFSPANTSAGMKTPGSTGARRDDENEATLFCIFDVIQLLRPRVVTLEQTFGIEMLQKHKPTLYHLIGMLTDHGYSVTMRVINMLDYGVPQNRDRVIIVASCPGTDLPTFPTPTHGSGHGRLPRFRWINDCIDDERPDGNRPLKHIITTSGTIDGAYSISELLRLQTFPRSFQFPPDLSNTDEKKQIGNAVPPVFAKTLMRSIIASLKAQDTAHAVTLARGRRPSDTDDSVTEDESGRRRKRKAKRSINRPGSQAQPLLVD